MKSASTFKHSDRHLNYTLLVSVAACILCTGFQPVSHSVDLVPPISIPISHIASHHTGAFTWDSRRFLPPDDEIRYFAGISGQDGIIPEFGEFEETPSVLPPALPTSSPHYIPKPRDPPLT